MECTAAKRTMMVIEYFRGTTTTLFQLFVTNSVDDVVVCAEKWPSKRICMSECSATGLDAEKRVGNSDKQEPLAYVNLLLKLLQWLGNVHIS